MYAYEAADVAALTQYTAMLLTRQDLAIGWTLHARTETLDIVVYSFRCGARTVASLSLSSLADSRYLPDPYRDQ